MPTWVELLPFAALGALGSLHCVGMCGGFAVAATGSKDARLVRLGAYVLGKAATYAVLGAIVAHAAALSVRTTHALGLHELRAWLAWLAGGTLVLTGLGWLAVRLRSRLSGWGLGRVPDALERGARWLYVTLRGLPGTTGALGTGLLTGLLPCGLSWSALLLATQLSPPAAGAGMLVFGLATGPALGLTALGWNALPARARAGATRFAGVLCIALGVLTIARGGLPERLAPLERALPDCCRDADAGTVSAAER